VADPRLRQLLRDRSPVICQLPVVAVNAATERRGSSGEQMDRRRIIEHPKGRFDPARADWQRTEGSNIEVGFHGALIGMRNADEPDGPVLVFTQAEWEAFTAGVNDGEFDPEALAEA